MKTVWIQFKDGIETDERRSVVERVKTLVKTASRSTGKMVASYANDSDQEHFDSKLTGYIGKGRPILLQVEDPDELKGILDSEFPGLCTVVDAPL